MVGAGSVLVLAVLVIVAARSGILRDTLEAGRRVGPASFVLALIVTSASMLISGMVWMRVLRCMGCHAPLRVSLAVYAGSGLAAYAASGAGAAGQCALLLRPHGVGPTRAVLLLVLASLVGFCGAMMWAPCGVALLAAPAAARALPGLGAHGPFLAILVTAVFGVGALMVLILLALAPRLGARIPVARAIADRSGISCHLSLRRLLGLIPYAALAWGVGAGPLWLLAHAAAPAANISLPAAIGIQTMASVAGSVTFFMPNGLGARDGAIVSLLVAVAGVPLPAAAAVAVLVRASDPVAKVLIVAVVVVCNRLWPHAR